MGWIFAVLFHSAFLYTATTRLHVGLGAGAAPVQDLSLDMALRMLWVMGTSLPEAAAGWSLQSQEQPNFSLWPQEDALK